MQSVHEWWTIFKDKQNEKLYIFRHIYPHSKFIQMRKGMMNRKLREVGRGDWEGTVRGLWLLIVFHFLSWMVDLWVFIIMLSNLPIYYVGYFAWIKCVKIKSAKGKKKNTRQEQLCISSDQSPAIPSRLLWIPVDSQKPTWIWDSLPSLIWGHNSPL